jgi:citrate synthase
MTELNRKDVRRETQDITQLVLDAKQKAFEETGHHPTPDLPSRLDWPIQCTVGPGLEGAIACETKIGYVNGQKGWLVYRGYDVFDLCAHSNFEEVSFLLLHGHLPSSAEYAEFQRVLTTYRYLPDTSRLFMSFPVESLNPMSALRLGTNLMRQKQTFRDMQDAGFDTLSIAADEDSIPMETPPMGEERAIYEFDRNQPRRPASASQELTGSEDLESCYQLIAGLPTLVGTIARVRAHRMPLEPRPDLGHAANLLYMMTGHEPDPLAERIMDIALILHADHGMNASTFAALVVASTLSDIYFSVGSGISALAGPLHGGANEQVIKVLREIGGPENVDSWYDAARKEKRKVPGFGHRVYKAYDPRARILGPLAGKVVQERPQLKKMFETAVLLEDRVVSSLGEEKKIFPNVDFYSGLVYAALGIPDLYYTPLFAVSRVAGWTARTMEYLEHNRIFRPRAIYTGDLNTQYRVMEER